MIQTATAAPAVRCAIYTRKSTDEGLEQAFNSLDAQRDSAEAYIASQAGQGWVCLPDRYDDGGYTGGNIERPGLQQLLADIEAGNVDCVIVYKVDRLSRSLMDFARMMETFERHGVSFVSVTQHFNTAHSMGRLTLNILLSFAQFERELISERTRDKIAGARRKGKWAGGRPLLGFDIDPVGPRLVINEEEASQIRTIFELYAECHSILDVAEQINDRGWTTKRWVTKTGVVKGDCPFNKTRLHRLLTNVAYIGKIRHRDDVYEGEHEAIIDLDLWRRVQTLLKHNGRNGRDTRRPGRALLQGLLFCHPCGMAMSHSFTTKKSTRYRYYVCIAAQKNGWKSCPSRSIPANQIEHFVVNHIRQIGKDPKLIRAVVAEARTQEKVLLEELESKGRDAAKEVRSARIDLRAAERNGDEDAIDRLEDTVTAAQRRAADIQEQIDDAHDRLLTRTEVVAALRQFDPVWAALSSFEQTRLLRLLIRRIDYDGGRGTVTISFLATGLRTLAKKELTDER